MISLLKIYNEIKVIHGGKDWKAEYQKIWHEVADMIGEWDEWDGDDDRGPHRTYNTNEITDATNIEFKKRFGFDFNDAPINEIKIIQPPGTALAFINLLKSLPKMRSFDKDRIREIISKKYISDINRYGLLDPKTYEYLPREYMKEMHQEILNYKQKYLEK